MTARAPEEVAGLLDAALAEAIAAGGFGTFDLELETLRLRLSRGTEECLGFEPGSITDLESFHALIDPEDVARTIALYETAVGQRAPRYEFSYRIRTRDGAWRTMKGSARCIYAEDGTPVRLIGSNAEVDPPRAGQLATQQEQMRSVLNAVPDAMIVVDQHGIIQSFNQGAEETFGYRAEEAVGRGFALLAPRELTGNNEVAFSRFLRASRPGQPSRPLLTRGRRADAREIPLEVRIEDVSGEGPKLFAMSLRDISDRLDTEERLRTLSDELAHAMRVNAMGEMAADIAHELNQPLAALANYLEAAKLVLKQTEAPDPRAMEMLDAAARQTVRAGAIIRRIRKFVTRGEVDVRIEPVEETVRDAVNLVFVGRAQYDVRVTCAFDRQARFMLADRVQVQQVIVNLLRNSIDALQQMPPDRRNILVKGSRIDDMVEISVIDTGPGIPDEVLDRLYQPFRSTKGSGGMGVGLTISRRIVEAHGGDISAENRPDGGAAFRFTIPALSDEASLAEEDEKGARA